MCVYVQSKVCSFIFDTLLQKIFLNPAVDILCSNHKEKEINEYPAAVMRSHNMLSHVDS
jgi:hypothetical protein